MGFSYNVNVLNQKGSPAIYTDTFANRPSPGYAGRLFISSDTSAIYEDTGTAWTLIANVSSGAGTLEQVTTNGNTTTKGISISAGGLSTNSLTDTALTLGSVLFAGAAGLVTQDNAAFFFDDTNNRLGINTTTPTNTLDLHFAGTTAMLGLNNTAGNQSAIIFSNTGANKWRIGNTSTNNFDFYNSALALTAITINATSNVAYFNQNIFIKHGGTFYNTAGYNSIGSDINGFYFQRDSNLNVAYFNFGSLTTTRNFTFPDVTGTVALTSDLGNYLPLSGGTLTGFLGGTYATFTNNSNNLTLNNAIGTASQLLFSIAGVPKATLSWDDTVPEFSIVSPRTRISSLLAGVRADFTSRLNVNGATDDGTTALNVTGTAKLSGNLILGTLSSGSQGSINGATGTINRAIVNCPYPGASALTLGYYSGAYGLDIWVNGDGTGLAPVYIDQRNNEKIVFRKNTQATATQTLSIESTGNVLINSTTDDTVNKLQVTGSASISGNLKCTNLIANPNGTYGAGYVAYANLDNNTITLSTVFSNITFTSNAITLRIQLIMYNGNATGASSCSINCVRNGGSTWTYSVVSNVADSVGGGFTPTLTFGGTSAAPTLRITGASYISASLEILSR